LFYFFILDVFCLDDSDTFLVVPVVVVLGVVVAALGVDVVVVIFGVVNFVVVVRVVVVCCRVVVVLGVVVVALGVDVVVVVFGVVIVTLGSNLGSLTLSLDTGVVTLLTVALGLITVPKLPVLI